MRFIEGDINALLAVAEMSKSRLADNLGVTRGAVSKWKGRMPMYVHAYMKLLIEHIGLTDEEIIERLDEWQVQNKT